jgi:uncharacterized repeat protein (TIGR02059 family)
MAEVTRTTAKTYFNTGDIPTESQFGNLLDSIPFPSSDAVFTALSGTVWDGSFKSLALTANTALTFTSTRRSGVLIVKQDATGSRTLTINGASVAINTAANATSMVTFLYNDVINDYIFSVETAIVGVSGGVDTTAPSLLTATVENANPYYIDLTYNEALSTASAPSTTDFVVNVNGSSVSIANVAITGSICRVIIAVAITNGQTVSASYTPGTNKIKDVAGNNAASFSNIAVTNNVAAVGGTFSTANRLAFYKNSSMVRSGGQVTKWTNVDGNTAWDFSPYSLSTNPVDATTQGMQITNTENLKTPARISQATPITFYALIKKTADGGAILANTTNGNGYGLVMGASAMYFSPANAAGYYWDSAAGIAIMSAFKVLTVTWNGPGSSPKVYLDGALVTGSFTEHSTAPDSNYILDYLFGYGSNLYKGYMNGLAFFSVAHDAATVAAQYSLFKTAAEA